MFPPAPNRPAGEAAHDLTKLLAIIDRCAGQLLELHPGADPSGKLALEIQRASRQAAELNPAAPGRSARPRRTGEVVLLVEDEAMVRTLSSNMLRSLGYLVINAADGVEALRKCEDRTINLLITDVVMPHMNGRELAERITARRPETKVLFISGPTDDAILREGVSRGEPRYLQKPFTPAALADAVRGALDGCTTG